MGPHSRAVYLKVHGIVYTKDRKGRKKINVNCRAMFQIEHCER